LELANLCDHQAAIQDFSRAIELKPEYVSAYLHRGMSYHKLKDHQAAILDYTKAIELKPDYAKALCNRGISYSDLRNYQAAMDDFTRAINLKPDDADPYISRGVVQARSNDYDGAIASTRKAIACNPKSAIAYDNLGYFYLEKGILDLAEENFEQSLRLDNKNWDASLGLALLSFQKMHLADARKRLAMASAIEPRLRQGMNGIKELETEGWDYSENRRRSLQKLFKAAK
jgi:tetratricopeptide (TPR) repeat protein